jgi:hypothetical protein
MVTQVDEDQPTMVAAAIHPAGQPDGLADMRLAQFAAGMGAIGMHDGKTFKTETNPGRMWRTAPSLVKGGAFAA